MIEYAPPTDIAPPMNPTYDLPVGADDDVAEFVSPPVVHFDHPIVQDMTAVSEPLQPVKQSGSSSTMWMLVAVVVVAAV